MTEDPRFAAWQSVGGIATVALGITLLSFAMTVDFPKAAHGFQSDEATYYSLAYSLAYDLDFEYRREDLMRVWKEFPTGPEGIFLKRGKQVDVRRGPSFPFVEWVKQPDVRQDRLYYGKSYIYPLVAAPFVWLFGTNGFLVLHAILLTLGFAAAYVWLRARGPTLAAVTFAFGFLFASAAPVYFVWLTPDLFNLVLVLFAYFLWTYKEVIGGAEIGRRGFLHSAGSDYAAALLLGAATFSKPINLPLILPLLLLATMRKRWRHTTTVAMLFGLTVTLLFFVNVAISGELNYQGGDRKTFYGGTGFPFQTPAATFDMVGQSRATNRVPTEVLINRDAFLTVFRQNLLYFTLGRHTGLVPYFFPGVVSLLLFFAIRRGRQPWQWFVFATLLVSSVALLLYMPFTYSGGGGPIGNRYFLGMYPLLLFLTPPLASPLAGLAALAVGGLFTARLVFNPFETSFYPAEHPKSGPFRLLPVELSLVNDLPINTTPSRTRQPLGGIPPVTAYFLDDNAYAREGDSFWVKGESRADIILRAPVRQVDAQAKDSAPAYTPTHIRRLTVELRTGDVANRITLKTNGERRSLQMNAYETQVVNLQMKRGLPYRPYPEHPTNYVYLVSIATEAGFVPLFNAASRDNRFLGVMVRITPVYE